MLRTIVFFLVSISTSNYYGYGSPSLDGLENSSASRNMTSRSSSSYKSYYGGGSMLGGLGSGLSSAFSGIGRTFGGFYPFLKDEKKHDEDEKNEADSVKEKTTKKAKKEKKK